MVIPKPIREEAGLAPNTDLEVSVRDGHVEIEPAAVPTRLVVDGDRVFIQAEEQRAAATDGRGCQGRARKTPSVMAADSRVVVAAALEWHEYHGVAEAAVKRERPSLPAHVAFDSYSVLTRLPDARRVSAAARRRGLQP